MAKWFHEEILIPYWEDSCKEYSFHNGIKILEAKRNPSFGKYPDISQNVLSNGEIVPCEIEWETTNFEQHGHDINFLRNNNGFLLTFMKNASFPLPQIEIDKDDFINWFIRNAEVLARETVQEVKSSTKRSKEPMIWLFYIGTRGKRNFDIAFEKGVWGFSEAKYYSARSLYKISQIKQNDIVIFIRHISLPNSASGTRLTKDKFIGKIKEIKGVVVTKGLYEERNNIIWEDKIYPYRFNFNKNILFSGKDIPCNPDILGKSLHEILRNLSNHHDIEKIDSNFMVKFMSLCTLS